MFSTHLKNLVKEHERKTRLSKVKDEVHAVLGDLYYSIISSASYGEYKIEVSKDELDLNQKKIDCIRSFGLKLSETDDGYAISWL